MAFNEVLAAAFAKHADANALLSQDGQILTFAKLERTVSVLTARLRAEGLGPGQRVALLTDNRALRIALMLALARLGPETALIASAAALARLGVEVDAAIRFADQSGDGARRSIVFSQDWLDGEPDRAPLSTPPGKLILSTSGSTGAPRYVRMRPETYLNLVHHHGDGTGESLGPVLVTIPDSSPFSIYLLLRAFQGGHGFTGMSPTGAQSLVEAERFGVREMMVTPLALNELVSAAERGAPKGDLARIVVFGSVAEGSLLARAEDAFGCGVYICVGATEIGQTSFGRFDRVHYVTGWSGRPLRRIELRIAAGEGDHGGGRLLLRAPPEDRVEGYLGGPPVYDADGWFDSGDIARLTSDGVLTIEGRADNVINLGGAKYAAERVEAVAGQCPGVSMCAAVRLDPPGAGAPELGLAVVASTGFDAAHLKALLAQKLRTSATIRVIECAELPSLPTGKLDRAAVTRLFG